MSTLVPTIKLRNARAWAPRTPLRWPIAFAAFLAAVLVRLALHDQLGPQYPLISFTIATLIVHFFLGLWPAIFVALTGLLAGTFFFVPPYNTLTMPEPQDMYLISYFVATTALFMVLIQYLRRALYQSVLLAELAESRYLMLLDSEADRAAAETEMRERQA